MGSEPESSGMLEQRNEVAVDMASHKRLHASQELASYKHRRNRLLLPISQLGEHLSNGRSVHMTVQHHNGWSNSEAEEKMLRHGAHGAANKVVVGSCDRVVVFSASGCPMCTVAEHLLFSLGVGPTIVVLDRHVDGPAIREVLTELADGQQQAVPAVFVGGKFLGGVKALMACHINSNLIPLLKHSAALWL